MVEARLSKNSSLPLSYFNVAGRVRTRGPTALALRVHNRRPLSHPASGRRLMTYFKQSGPHFEIHHILMQSAATVFIRDNLGNTRTPKIGSQFKMEIARTIFEQSTPVLYDVLSLPFGTMQSLSATDLNARAKSLSARLNSLRESGKISHETLNEFDAEAKKLAKDLREFSAWLTRQEAASQPSN